MRRFYLSDLKNPIWELEGDEGRHLAQVLRAKEGEVVTLFDGQGHEAHASITTVKKKKVILQALGNVQFVDRRPRRDICVAVVFPKARSRGILMEKLVELGVKEVQPIMSHRGVESPDTQRLLSQAVTACKQCGINHLPLIHSPLKLKKFIENPPKNPVLLHPQGNSTLPEADPITVVVGPEGGFSDEEVDMMPWAKWSMGQQILRSETACMAAVAKLI